MRKSRIMGIPKRPSALQGTGFSRMGESNKSRDAIFHLIKQKILKIYG